MKEKKLIRIGNLFGATGGSFAGNIYDPEGLCPAINTAGGGYREPMIVEHEDIHTDLGEDGGGETEEASLR